MTVNKAGKVIIQSFKKEDANKKIMDYFYTFLLYNLLNSAFLEFYKKKERHRL